MFVRGHGPQIIHQTGNLRPDQIQKIIVMSLPMYNLSYQIVNNNFQSKNIIRSVGLDTHRFSHIYKTIFQT